MAQCKTEEDDWLLAHLKYLLFIFNFFFWVSGDHGIPHQTAAVWPGHVHFRVAAKVDFSQGEDRAGGSSSDLTLRSEPALLWLRTGEGSRVHLSWSPRHHIQAELSVCSLIYLPCHQHTVPILSWLLK